MKAEHRKELQTNSLADMLGRTVLKVRGGTGFPWTRVILVLIVVLAIAVFFWWKRHQANNNAELWMRLDDNTQKAIQQVIEDSKETNQGKAAMLMIAFEWQYDGVRMVGGGPQMQPTGILQLKQSLKLYEKLTVDCDGNDEWVAEAKYGQAVATEALTIEDPDNLNKAKNLYAELAKGNLGKTGFGVLAARRLEQLENQTEQAAIANFYRDFSGGAFRIKSK